MCDDEFYASRQCRGSCVQNATDDATKSVADDASGYPDVFDGDLPSLLHEHDVGVWNCEALNGHGVQDDVHFGTPSN